MRRRAFIGVVGASLPVVSGCIDRGLRVTDLQSSDAEDLSSPRPGVPSIPRVETPPEGETPNEPGAGQHEAPPEGTVLETFESLTHVETGRGLTISANTRDAVTGTQCAEVEYPNRPSWYLIPFDQPVDLSESYVAARMAYGGSATGDRPFVDLRDVDGNVCRLRSTVRRSAVTWHDFGLLEPTHRGSAVDRTRIDGIIVRPSATRGSGDSNIHVIDSIRRVPTGSRTQVVFQFDDGAATDLTRGAPVLSRYGYPATTYVNPGTIGTGSKLSVAELHELRDRGWLVASHGWSHADLTDLDLGSVEAEVSDAKAWLEDHGFYEGANHFAYPFNRTNDDVVAIVERYHDTGRVAGVQPRGPPVNPQFLPGLGDPTFEEARSLVDTAVAYGGVVVIYFHTLVSEREDAFRRIVEYVHGLDRTGDLEVVRTDRLSLGS